MFVKDYLIPYNFSPSNDYQFSTTNFFIPKQYTSGRKLNPKSNSIITLSLVPLYEFQDQVSFLESRDLIFDKDGQLVIEDKETTSPHCLEPFVVGIAEEDDLPDVSRLTIDVFGADTVTLSGELNDFERALIGPTIGLWNAYTDTLAYTEVLSGLRSRVKDRLAKPCLGKPAISRKEDNQLSNVFETVSGSSLILVVARDKSADSNPLYCKLDPIASVELRLQPTDAKIPFSQPWLDKFERKIAALFDKKLIVKDDIQPYLSNLCVAEGVRGKKIGKSLVRCVERIAHDIWGYNKVYLHVDLKNEAALKLYIGEGYTDVGSRWNPFWAGKAADIGYFVKTIKEGL